MPLHLACPSDTLRGKGAAVTLVWETAEPYESVVEASAPEGAVLRGLRLRHSSKSIANNAAVFCRGGALTLEARSRPLNHWGVIRSRQHAPFA